jgi:hypothetical protein
MLAYITGNVNEDLLRRIEYLLESLTPFALLGRRGANTGNRCYGFGVMGRNWQDLVFGRFAEAVELTAVQRGCERSVRLPT